MGILVEDFIHLDISEKDYESVIKKLGKTMERNNYVKETFINAVIEREKIYPTGLPSSKLSVAIPHTDTKHVKKSSISIGILKEPIEFKMMGNIKKSLKVKIVLLLAIKDSAMQIDLLKKLMTVIQNGQLLSDIYNAGDKKEIIKLLDMLNFNYDIIQGGE